MLVNGRSIERFKLTLGSRSLMMRREKHQVAGDDEEPSSDAFLVDV